jgi:acetone carboxylase gamma subunit
LYTKSVVLSLVKAGKEVKWKNLDKVWHLLRDKDKFYQYIKTKVQKFLDSLPEGS